MRTTKGNCCQEDVCLLQIYWKVVCRAVHIGSQPETLTAVDTPAASIPGTAKAVLSNFAHVPSLAACLAQQAIIEKADGLAQQAMFEKQLAWHSKP